MSFSSVFSTQCILLETNEIMKPTFTILFTLVALCLQAQVDCGDDHHFYGTISTSCGIDIEAAFVNISSNQPEYPQVVNGDTFYDGLCHAPGFDYEVVCYKNDDILNGVSTLDLAIMQQLILVEMPFESMLQFIAADVNNDGVLSTLDIVELEKVILGQQQGFTNNSSWRFFDADKLDPGDLSTFHEVVSIENLDALQEINWIGVKIGDVNCTVVSGGVNCDDGYRLAGTVFDRCGDVFAGEIEYKLDSNQEGYPMEYIQTGFYDLACHAESEDYTISLYNNDNVLNGVSTLDHVMISRHIQGIEPFNSVAQLIAADINRDNSITAADLVELEKVILGEQPTFTNNTSWRFFDASADLDLSAPETLIEEIQIQDLQTDLVGLDWLAIKIGDVNNSSLGCGVTSSLPKVNDVLIDVSVHPNPFTQKIKIDLSSLTYQEISIRIVDANGKLVYRSFKQIHSGDQMIIIEGQNIEMLENGLYFLTLTGEHSSSTIQLIKS